MRKTRRAGGANTVHVPDLAKITDEEYDIIDSMLGDIENISESSGRNHAFVKAHKLTDDYFLKLRNALVGISNDDPDRIIYDALNVDYDAVYKNNYDSNGYNYNKEVYYQYEMYEIVNMAINDAKWQLEDYYKKWKANTEKRAKNLYFTLHQTTHLPSNLIGKITEMNTGLKRTKKSRRKTRKFARSKI